MTTVKGRFVETISVRNPKQGSGKERWGKPSEGHWVKRDGESGRFSKMKLGGDFTIGQTVIVAAISSTPWSGAVHVTSSHTPSTPAPEPDQKVARQARIKAISKLGIALHRQTLAALAK